MNTDKKNFEIKSNRLKLAWLRGWAEGSAIISKKPDFELEHLKNVADFANKTACTRDLDTDVLLYAAYLHDVGRYSLECYGKKHGLKGTKKAKNILKKLDVNKKTIKKVQTMIKNHSNKEEVNDKYSEALKDADSMAHKMELMDLSEKPYELFRSENALLPPAELFLISETDLSTVLKNSWLSLKNKILKLSEKDEKADADYFMKSADSLEPFETDDIREIKEVRIAIRKMRTLIGFFNKNKTVYMKKKLNMAFLTLEKTRKFSVVKKYLKKFDVYENLKDKIEKEDIRLRELAVVTLKKEFDIETLEAMEDNVKAISAEVSSLKINPYKYLIKYSETLKTAANNFEKNQKEQIKNLHKLRIEGKRLKYLIEDGIFEFVNCNDYNILTKLHDTLGDVNDLRESGSYIRESEIFKADEKLIKLYKEKEHEQSEYVKKELEFLLFMMGKRLA